MANLDLLLEADRRGLLPPETKALLDEATRRGLVATTAPEDNATLAGPPRPTLADLEMSPMRGVGQTLVLSDDQKSAARQAESIMRPDEAARTQTALAQDELAFRNQIAKPSPVGMGVTGAIAPHLADKGMAAIEALIYQVTGGKAGQPYPEAAETNDLAREQNWQEHPVLTALSGAAILPRLPMVAPLSATSKAGWAGNAALTGGAYGAAHGAGAGQGVQEGVQGAASEGLAGLATGGALGQATQRFRPQSAQEMGRIANAEFAGVRLPQAAASDSPATTQNAGLLSKMPLVGGRLQKSLNRAVDDVESGINRAAQGYAQQGMAARTQGPAPLPGDAAVGQSAIDRIRRRVTQLDPDRMEQQFRVLAGQIDPARASPLEATRRLAAQLLQEDRTNASTIHNPVLEAVQDAITRPNGMSYEGLLGLRRNIGALQKADMVTAGGTAQPAFRRLYGALSQDLRGLVREAGRPGALETFDRTMVESQRLIHKRQLLEQIVGKDGLANPQQIVDQVGRWAANGAGRDIRKLITLSRAVGPDVMNDLASTTLQRAIMKNHKAGEFSLAAYDKFWKSLTPAGRQVLFGRDPRLVDSLDALSRSTDDLQRVLGEANTSKTAYGNFLIRTIESAAHMVNRMLTGVAGLATGVVGGGAVVADLAGVAGAGTASMMAPIALGRLIANSLAKPATVRHLTRVNRALARYVRSPDGGPSQTAAIALRLALVGLADEAAKANGEKPEDVRRQLLKAVSRPGVLEFAP